jgi:hypothetical protein
MINIEIVSYNGQPPAQPVRVEFDEMGGRIKGELKGPG